MHLFAKIHRFLSRICSQFLSLWICNSLLPRWRQNSTSMLAMSWNIWKNCFSVFLMFIAPQPEVYTRERLLTLCSTAAMLSQQQCPINSTPRITPAWLSWWTTQTTSSPTASGRSDVISVSAGCICKQKWADRWCRVPAVSVSSLFVDVSTFCAFSSSVSDTYDCRSADSRCDWSSSTGGVSTLRSRCRQPSSDNDIPTLYVLNAEAITKPLAVEHLAVDLTGYKADTAVVTKTHLKKRHAYHNLAIDGYSLFRRDRVGRRGGGVTVYVNSRLPADVWTCPGDSAQFELLWIRVQVHRQTVYVGALYHPPKASVSAVHAARLHRGCSWRGDDGVFDICNHARRRLQHAGRWWRRDTLYSAVHR